MKLAKVMLVEDDTDIQTVVKMSLKVRGVSEIITAESGEECLALAAQVQPDVILMDVMMPRMDGYEACRRLKADSATCSIPVIFLTAKAQHFEAKEGMDCGGIGYLIKPFDPMNLHDQILAILRSREEKAE
jgi:DNA-binding response OmpR family regulator